MNVRLPLGKGMFVWLVDRLLPKSGVRVKALAGCRRQSLAWIEGGAINCRVGSRILGAYTATDRWATWPAKFSLKASTTTGVIRVWG